MFTGLEEYYNIWEKSTIKASVALEEAACNLIYYLQWCHTVTRLNCGWSGCQDLNNSPLSLHSIWLIMDSLKTNDQNQYIRTRDIAPSISRIQPPFKTLHLHYPWFNCSPVWWLIHTSFLFLWRWTPLHWWDPGQWNSTRGRLPVSELVTLPSMLMHCCVRIKRSLPYRKSAESWRHGLAPLRYS